MKSPLSVVKDRFGSKKDLVAAVEKLSASDLFDSSRLNEEGGFAHISNTKLVRLHDLLETTNKEFGSRAKLVEAVLELEHRSKDADYKQRLSSFPLGRLVDAHRGAVRRAKNAADAPKQPKKTKVARSKKAKAKRAAAS